MNEPWETPSSYWIVQTLNGMVRLEESQAERVRVAVDERKGSVRVVDIYDADVTIFPKAIEMIYNSTPELRDRGTMHNEERRIAEERAIKEYRQSVGYFSED